MARDLANLERNIEQLKANQQQIASDNSKAIEELKASQEEMKRALAKVSEQSPPKASPPAGYDATGSGLAQARAAAAAGESAASISEGMDVRRLVAADSVIIEVWSGNTACSLYAPKPASASSGSTAGCRSNNLEFIEKKRGAK